MAKSKVLEKLFTPKPELPTSVVNDLATKIEVVRAECDAYLDRRAEELRQSAPGVPVGVLRGILTGNDSCQCRAALHAMSRK